MTDKAYKKSLLSIGEMAQLFRMNIRTLRYYDALDILKPEHIDPDTNYRYYSTKQFEVLNTIKYLRALDVPLAKISTFFGEKDANAMLAIFLEQRESVLQKQKELKQIERKISNRIVQLETALKANHSQIESKCFPKRKIILLEKNFTLDTDFEVLIRTLSENHCLEDSIFLGKIGVSVSYEKLIARDFGKFSSVFFLLEDADEAVSTTCILPEGKYLTIQYKGTHENAAEYYTLLLDHLEKNGGKVDGDSVEIALIDAGMTNDVNQFVTEIQVPFE